MTKLKSIFPVAVIDFHSKFKLVVDEIFAVLPF